MSAKKPERPHIGMCDCVSGQVKRHGYDAATRTLAVEFTRGGVYHYSNVPAKTYNALKQAKSVGAFIATRVRGTHAFTKIS